ncbi:hypothetical protein QJQ45_027221 [Haematococcus lacustris]|nr:hypothetical protein QJQ45_027221 [Haematococcus lacustris]
MYAFNDRRRREAEAELMIMIAVAQLEEEEAEEEARSVFNYVLGSIADHPLLARNCKRTDFLTQEEQLAIALSYLAKGSNLSHVGSTWGCSKTMVSRCIANVTMAMWDRLSHHISLPRTEADWQATVLEFEHISGLPQIVGALDGSHIRIDQPDNVGHAYYNHKGFQSFVAQGLVNARGKFMDVYAGHPGRTHDALVFPHSPLARQLSDDGSHLAQSLARGVHVIGGVEVPRVIVADSAYATRQFVVSSFKTGIARDNAAKARFNTMHSKARVKVEHAWGWVKNKFQCCRLGIRTDVKVAVMVFMCCCILHNICIDHGEAVPEGVDPDAIQDYEARLAEDGAGVDPFPEEEQALGGRARPADLVQGERIREALVMLAEQR